MNKYKITMSFSVEKENEEMALWAAFEYSDIDEHYLREIFNDFEVKVEEEL